MQGAAESPAGSGRAITRLPALARFAPRPLLLDLADQVSTHLREGMIKVALVGGGHEVRPSREPGLEGDLLVRTLGVFLRHLEVDLVVFPSRQVRRECDKAPRMRSRSAAAKPAPKRRRSSRVDVGLLSVPLISAPLWWVQRMTSA